MQGHRGSLWVFGVLLFASHVLPQARGSAATRAKTGELLLTFTQRSSLSTRSEIAARLNVKASDLGPDYDLSAIPFETYVPPSYDPATPCGVLVYLGYKDTVLFPQNWEPALDKARLIFISPACHAGNGEGSHRVEFWQMIGRAFDAVENLKRSYNIDPRRIYLMSYNQGSMRMSLGAADVFTGLVSALDPEYCRSLFADHGHLSAGFPLPPGNLFAVAKARPIVLLEEALEDTGYPVHSMIPVMKGDGFKYVVGQKSSLGDLQYPDLKRELLEQSLLPFLDKSVLSEGTQAVRSGAAVAGSTPALISKPGEAMRGELDLTFSQRSPLSKPKEIARRLNLKDAELGADYDLSHRSFKAYVPFNYDPGTPYGVFVYLGYVDPTTPVAEWQPILDQSHLIFITPVCHSGNQYPNAVPAWQIMGLAFDAVENLKRSYNIDNRRLYLMSSGDGSMRMSLGAADVFTGLLVAFDGTYCEKVSLSQNQFYPAAFPPPPGLLLDTAKRRAIAILHPLLNDPNSAPSLLVSTLKRTGFQHVLGQELNERDILYPHLTVPWFEQSVLPFLDKACVTKPIPPAAAPGEFTAPPAASPAGAKTSSPTTRAASTAAENPEAQHLLSMAQLYIANNRPALARAKLQAILNAYPADPCAAAAKKLLTTLPPP